MSRYDMISKRPLRPAAQMPLAVEVPVVYPDIRQAPLSRQGMVGGVLPGCRPAAPPKPPQPALVVVEPMSKSIDSDIDLFPIHKSLAKAAFPVSEMMGATPSTNTPEHEHARLQAKKVYLEEKLAQHAAAGHHAEHPEVRQRRSALGTVNSKLKDLEAAGHVSDSTHHSDWMHKLSKNPGGRFSPEHVSVGLSAHTAALGGQRTQASRKEMGITPGMGLEKPAKKQPSVSAEAPTVLNTKVAPVREEKTHADSPAAKQAQSSTGGPQLSLMRAMNELMDMAKAKDQKSDDWISQKISKLMHEGKPQKQAIAIAYSMAGRSRVKKSNPLLIVAA